MAKETALYDVLQVQPSADATQIRKAFKACALRYHPDKLRNVKDEAERKRRTELFKEMTHAYEVLSDTTKRRTYDKYGEAGLNGEVAEQQSYRHSMSTASRAPNDVFAEAETMFNDVFNSGFAAHTSGSFFDDSFFQGFGSAGGGPQAAFEMHSKRRRGLRRGRDIQHTLACSLEDFYMGKTYKLSLARHVKCSQCEGMGGYSTVKCTTCGGSGIKVTRHEMKMDHGMSGIYQLLQTTCPDCKGAGKKIPRGDVCTECQGEGFYDQKEILEVVVPRGAQSGHTVVFPGGADEGPGISPGDVIVTLKEDRRLSSRHYVRHGDDLLTTVKVPLHTALCGGAVPLRFLDGRRLSVHVTRGEVHHADEVRVIHNYGMPITTKEHGQPGHVIGYGDLYMRLETEFPRPGELSEKQYQLLDMALGSKGGVLDGDVDMGSQSEPPAGEDNVVYLSSVDHKNPSRPDPSMFP